MIFLCTYMHFIYSQDFKLLEIITEFIETDKEEGASQSLPLARKRERPPFQQPGGCFGTLQGTQYFRVIIDYLFNTCELVKGAFHIVILLDGNSTSGTHHKEAPGHDSSFHESQALGEGPLSCDCLEMTVF